MEAHHIDYFVRSLNNDARNQMIVCPNHHRIINELDPVFDRRRIAYYYPNGYEQRLALNVHLRIPVDTAISRVRCSICSRRDPKQIIKLKRLFQKLPYDPALQHYRQKIHQDK